MSQRDRFVAWQLAHVGWEYDASGPWRCTGERHSFDCSGFQSAAMVAVGARNPGYCTNTNGEAAEIRAAGTSVSRATARVTPGCWAIRQGIGPHGHVVCTLGMINGVARTVEAASHATGVVIGYFDGDRGFTIFGRPPGLTGFDSTSSPTPTQGVNVGWKIEMHPKSTPVAPGYWCVDDLGHVYAYGIARYYGGQGSPLPAGGVVNLNGHCDGFAPTPTGHGYLMVSSVGSVYAFGDARKTGDPHGDPAT